MVKTDFMMLAALTPSVISKWEELKGEMDAAGIKPDERPIESFGEFIEEMWFDYNPDPQKSYGVAGMEAI